MNETPAVALRPTSSFGMTDLGLLLTILLWGSNVTISKLAFVTMPVMVFNAFRFMIAPTLLALVLLYREGKAAFKIAPELRRRIILIGFIGNSFYQLIFLNGVNLTTASNAALLLATTPLLVALIGRLRGETIRPLGWVGILVGFVGVVLVLAARGMTLSLGTLRGDLLIMLSVVSWAIYTIGAAPLLQKMSPLRATTLPMLFGSPIVVLAGIPAALRLNWSTIDSFGWGGMLYSATCSIALAYLLWYSSVQRVGPTRTGIYSSLLPVVGIAAAAIGLHEPILPVQLVGAALIFLGLWLARR